MALSLMVLGVAQAEETNSALESSDDSGPYFRGAFAIGLPNFDPKPATPGTQFGFTAALGYDIVPLLQAELEGSWAGGKTCSGCRDAGNFAILANARLFPLALFDGATDFAIQPYGLIGMGGGGAEFSGVYNGAFIFNLGAGADLMTSDTFGFYGEISQRWFAGDPKAFKGITNFNFGIIKRF